MSKTTHIVYILLLSIIVLAVFAAIAVNGFTYYSQPLSDRFFHPGHSVFKPSGTYGHGFGIVGSAIMMLGVGLYMIRKRVKRFGRLGILKHWLEFHIFLCSLGPVLVLYHTAFKFGGLVAISFWSMVAVFLSGIVGRFIYIQIPRTIEGRELTLNEIRELKNDPNSDLRKFSKDEASMNRRIERLQLMQKLFKYWHVAHLPFALIMLVIMIIHVAVTIAFGYRWIF